MLTSDPEMWMMFPQSARVSFSKCGGTEVAQKESPGVRVSRHLQNHLYSACKDTIM